MAYAERIHPPLSRNMLMEELNRTRPALSRDSLPDMRESVMPALSDRLLNAPEATSAPQHHQAQQIPPRPPMPEHPTMRMAQPPMPPRTPAPTPGQRPKRSGFRLPISGKGFRASSCGGASAS